MKYFSLLLLPALWLTACNQTTQKNQIPQTVATDKDTSVSNSTVNDSANPADKLIVPGKAIGQTAINASGQEVFKRLGKPDAGDAAMGKALSIWYAGHDSTGYETMIYTTRQMGTEDDAPKVKQIRVTSPWFVTAECIHNGSTLQEISKVFQITKMATFTLNKETYTIYKSARGIAFEINSKGICKGIIVFSTASQPGQMYLPFYSNMKMIR